MAEASSEWLRAETKEKENEMRIDFEAQTSSISLLNVCDTNFKSPFLLPLKAKHDC